MHHLCQLMEIVCLRLRKSSKTQTSDPVCGEELRKCTHNSSQGCVPSTLYSKRKGKSIETLICLPVCMAHKWGPLHKSFINLQVNLLGSAHKQSFCAVFFNSDAADEGLIKTKNQKENLIRND